MISYERPAYAISIHAPREGSDVLGAELGVMKQISIHAPREGSDPGILGALGGQKNFNPRSP